MLDHLKQATIRQLERLWHNHIKGMFDENGNFEGFGVREPCECFGGHEAPECEQGDRMKFKKCMRNPKCHWGPTELARCRKPNDAYREKHAALAQTDAMTNQWNKIML